MNYVKIIKSADQLNPGDRITHGLITSIQPYGFDGYSVECLGQALPFHYKRDARLLVAEPVQPIPEKMDAETAFWLEIPEQKLIGGHGP